MWGTVGRTHGVRRKPHSKSKHKGRVSKFDSKMSFTLPNNDVITANRHAKFPLRFRGEKNDVIRTSNSWEDVIYTEVRSTCYQTF
ncbi:hypothetical protein E2C01_055732 [Portunus trituberculatus]|uniref:Uncharacterized protein n=1 Tax=Portunus trituberculatus TaxID=210409 RepID=A0A5B7GWR8_PORTR|nr:hypothetical protein [Portunus trituberculatus]